VKKVKLLWLRKDPWGGEAVSQAIHGGPQWQKIDLGGGAYWSGQRDGDADETQGEGSFYLRASHKRSVGLRKGNGMARRADARAGRALCARAVAGHSEKGEATRCPRGVKRRTSAHCLHAC
jgi:hypothetical protein